MRTHVEFRSSKFPAYPGETEKVNPDLWGQRLAEYLREKLRERRIETGEISAEDWGWILRLDHKPFPMWIGCGHYQEYEDGYLVFIHPSKPAVRSSWFRKVDTTSEVARVADAIDAVLNSDPEIHGVRWWAENER